MNNLIITVIAFSIGIVCGAVFFACSVKAFDYEEPRFGDSYMDHLQQRQQLEDLQQRELLRTWESNRKNPCQ